MMLCQLGVEFYSDPEASDPLNGGSTAEEKRRGTVSDIRRTAKDRIIRESVRWRPESPPIFERARLRTFASCSAAKEALS